KSVRGPPLAGPVHTHGRCVIRRGRASLGEIRGGAGPRSGDAGGRMPRRSDDLVKRRLRAWSRLGLMVPLVATMLLGVGGAASAGPLIGAPPGSSSPAAGPILPVISCASLAHMNVT